MENTIVGFFRDMPLYNDTVNFLTNLLGFHSLGLVDFLIILTAVAIVLGALSAVGGLGTLAERKISADLQIRPGPNRVGPYGALQFLADGIKMILKEDIVPAQADRFLFYISPMLALVGVFGTLAVVPFSSAFILTDLNVGIFYLVGVSSIVGFAIFLGGYSSNSKWSMLGGMRGAAQIVSYEIPVVISILAIVLLAGGLSFSAILAEQTANPLTWYIFHNPFTFIGFFVFFIGTLAETNRAPFDLPEAESELVSGYHTEYTGMRYGFFALSEYIEVFVVSGIAATLFLGGYKVPFDLGGDGLVGQLLQVGVFFGKALALYYIVIWIRWTLPRMRVDSLMTLCWKYLTPIALFNLIGVAFWVYLFDGKSIFTIIFG